MMVTSLMEKLVCSLVHGCYGRLRLERVRTPLLIVQCLSSSFRLHPFLSFLFQCSNGLSAKVYCQPTVLSASSSTSDVSQYQDCA